MNFKKFITSFKFAISGLIQIFKNQQNFRFHIFIFILIIIAGFYWQINKIEWSLIFLTSALVIIAEIFNTVIEDMLNFLHPDESNYVAIIKDIAAAAVLVASIFAVIIGGIIFAPYIFKF